MASSLSCNGDIKSRAEDADGHGNRRSDRSPEPVTRTTCVRARRLPHQKAIEPHLEARLGERFNLNPVLLLYGVTDTYIERVGKADPTAKRGHSRDSRPSRESIPYRGGATEAARVCLPPPSPGMHRTRGAATLVLGAIMAPGTTRSPIIGTISLSCAGKDCASEKGDKGLSTKGLGEKRPAGRFCANGSISGVGCGRRLRGVGN